MKSRVVRFFAAAAVVFFLDAPAPGQSVMPPEVKPLVFRGVKFVALNSIENMGWIEARDLKTGGRLWKKKVYEVIFDPRYRSENQTVFITALEIKDGKLAVRNERGETFLVEIPGETPAGAPESTPGATPASAPVPAGILPVAATTGISPARVLVVYNANWPDADKDGVNDSRAVADYYLRKRGIPPDNLLGLTCSLKSRDYYYDHPDAGVFAARDEYPKFYQEVVSPIKARLKELGPENIDVILLVYGVPAYLLRPQGTMPPTYDSASIDNLLMGINYWTPDKSNVPWDIRVVAAGIFNNPYFERTPSIAKDQGHFDHALCKFNGGEMYLVTRLDGPRGETGAMEMVDQARYGERYIRPEADYYRGYAYLDSAKGQAGGKGEDTNRPYDDAYFFPIPEQPDRPRDSVYYGWFDRYRNADENIAFAKYFIVKSGFPLKWENTTDNRVIGEKDEKGKFYPTRFSDGTPAREAPAALFYGGWYRRKPGASPETFAWLPGSVVCDLNSSSAADFRNSEKYGAAYLRRGATCVAGVVAEPFLWGHQRPNVLYYYLLQGYDFAEAAALATPKIGWKAVNLGDPLYAPLKKKDPVRDTRAPVIAAGYPRFSRDEKGNWYVQLMVEDEPEPEVVTAEVDYGPDTGYGENVKSGPGYWRRHKITLPGLSPDATYHYRITLKDPVGNTTVTEDARFSTGTDAAAGAAPGVRTPGR